MVVAPLDEPSSSPLLLLESAGVVVVGAGVVDELVSSATVAELVLPSLLEPASDDDAGSPAQAIRPDNDAMHGSSSSRGTPTPWHVGRASSPAAVCARSSAAAPSGSAAALARAPAAAQDRRRWCGAAWACSSSPQRLSAR
jgi:hypothetical protein